MVHNPLPHWKDVPRRWRAQVRQAMPALLALLGLLAILSLQAAQAAGTLSSHTFKAKSYDGSRDRQYKVYVPAGVANPAPLVMALHGCEQTNDNVLDDWGLKAAADLHHFILVAPFITSYDGFRNTNCWGFWLAQHRQKGRGEPEDLHQIALEVEKAHPIDPSRRYVTGLSSGGAMTAVLAVTHNDYWAAAAPAAGLPYGEDAASVSLSGSCPGSATFHKDAQIETDMRNQLGSKAYPIPLLILQNKGDCTVLQAAAAHMLDAHLALFGDAKHQTPATTLAEQSACKPVFQQGFGCQQTRYTHDARTSSRSLVETVLFDGPQATPNTQDKDHGHYWVGGQDGREGPYALRQGPSYPEIAWAFFERHPQDGSTVVIAGGTGDTGGTGGTGETPPCAGETSSPSAHLGAGRGVASGLFGMTVLSTGDKKDIGWSWNWFSSVTLFKGPTGLWFFKKPAGCS